MHKKKWQVPAPAVKSDKTKVKLKGNRPASLKSPGKLPPHMKHNAATAHMKPFISVPHYTAEYVLIPRNLPPYVDGNTESFQAIVDGNSYTFNQNGEPGAKMLVECHCIGQFRYSKGLASSIMGESCTRKYVNVPFMKQVDMPLTCLRRNTKQVTVKIPQGVHENDPFLAGIDDHQYPLLCPAGLSGGHEFVVECHEVEIHDTRPRIIRVPDEIVGICEESESSVNV
jgi:hypothetical protein